MHSNPDALCLVRATLERATELLHFHETQTRAIVRSVDEALANVIRHAYKGKSGLPIEITCKKLRVDRNGAPVTIAKSPNLPRLAGFVLNAPLSSAICH